MNTLKPRNSEHFRQTLFVHYIKYFTISNVICLVNPPNGNWVLFTISQNSLYRGSLYWGLSVFIHKFLTYRVFWGSQKTVWGKTLPLVISPLVHFLLPKEWNIIIKILKFMPTYSTGPSGLCKRKIPQYYFLKAPISE